MARLLIQSPGKEQLLYELVKPKVTVGRSERNDLVLEDTNASRFHAVVESTPQGYRIADQNSRNGILVDGRRCQEAMLVNGVTVRLGDTLLRFEDSSAAWGTTTMMARGFATANLLTAAGESGLRDATLAMRGLAAAPSADVKELQQQLHEARRRALLFEVVSRARRAFEDSAGPQDVLATIPRLVFTAADAERVLVMLWDADKECLLPADLHTAPGLKRGDTEVALSQTLLNTVLQSRRAVLVRDAAADPQLLLRESVVRSGLRSAICAPMIVKERLYGLIYADNCNRPQVFEEDDLEVLAILAMEAALAIDSAHAREDVVRQERIRLAYRRFLPEHLAEMLIANPEAVRLGGTRQSITALFADLRGFTSLAETLPAEEAVDLLNVFFTEMAGIIFRHGGTLDKYLGDGLLAVFGAPLSDPTDALRAVKCAIIMQEALKELSQEWERQSRPVIPMGIGVNSGEAIAGNIGSPERMEYTVIGDTVNVAARLTAKAAAGEILLGESTWRLVQSQVPSESLSPMTLKGKREPVPVYRVCGPSP